MVANIFQNQQTGNLVELLNAGSYDELIVKSESRLQAHPLDNDALLFRGIAFFYKAVGEFDAEERSPYMDEAIFSLRKSALKDTGRWSGEADYVLGKAYFHKGKYYYDLAIQYLERSIQGGYVGPDTYEYLGLAFANLNQPAEALSRFKKALETRPTDLLYLTVGQLHINLEQPNEAERLLKQTIASSQDSIVEKRSRFLLGELYLDRADYTAALEQYEELTALDPSSADAFFYLGMAFEGLDDYVKARAAWRKARSLDPEHRGANLRLR